MSSFDSVNYSLRPSKNIERKLVFEFLRQLQAVLQIQDYRYIGFGSMWFVDFILAHRLLSIRSMVSMEKPEYAERAEFNRPFSCIKVEPGESTEVLPTLGLQVQESIFWLDYDSGLEGPCLQDLTYIVENAKAGSIVIVTLNAHKGRLPENDSDGNPINLETSLRQLAGDAVPASLSARSFQAKAFPATLAAVLRNHLNHVVRMAARGLRFVPILNLSYQDNAPMITIGGVLADEAQQAVLAAQKFEGWGDFAYSEEPHIIDAPPLTLREKLALDRLMPSEHAPSDADVRRLGFGLKERQRVAYHRFYRLYPMFGEVDV